MAYSEFEASEALIKLAINKGDYEKTARDTGISVRTLKSWGKSAPKKGVPELLERAIERLLMVVPTDLSGRDYAITLGILIDKWLLIQGEPTERTETLVQTFEALSDDERRAVVERAREIIADFSTVSDSSGNGRA